MSKKIIFLLTLMVLTTALWADGSSYLNFKAVNGSATIKLEKHRSPNSISLKYSTDNCQTWNTYTTNQTITLSSGSKVFFKANSTNGAFCSSSADWYNFVMTGTVKADGNIMSLLDASMQRMSVPQSGFRHLFEGCSSLIQAPVLPATSLNLYSYSFMFAGCTSLTQAPSLPATTLGGYCYKNMFDSCVSLTQAPSLPATSLSNYCYLEMFKNCSSLVNVPALPATTLASGCYMNMFRLCVSVTNAPTLPATKMENGCYEGMFCGCYSLTKTPALPATELEYQCYKGMFSTCTLLTQTPSLPAETLAASCYESMFYNCTALEYAPELPSQHLAASCYSFMFYGCKKLKETPVLPATVLKHGCYFWMFANCTSLKDLPDLSATKIETNSYSYMFKNCTSLKINGQRPGKQWNIPGNAVTDTDWNTEMFYGTSGTMTGNPQKGVYYYVESAPKITITAIAVNDDMGVVNGGGEYYENDTAVLEAIANDGYEFIEWSNGENSPILYEQVYSDSTFIAYFQPTTVDVDVVKKGFSVNITPNPVSIDEPISIIVDDFENSIVKVYSLEGVLLMCINNDNKILTIDGFHASGTYIVCVTLNNGNTIFGKLIVK